MEKGHYPTLTLKAGREKSLLKQHPWVFSGAVAQEPTAKTGDIVSVENQAGKTLGYGFYDTQSQIRVRIFAFLHPVMGSPPPLPFSASYWEEKIAQAFRLREEYVRSPQTNAYRLLHAEGDFLPGVIVDVYGETAVIQLLIQGTENIYPALQEGLKAIGLKYFYVKIKDTSRRLEGLSWEAGWQAVPPSLPLRISENGLSFEVDVEKGQKTGFFLDQRDNRALVKRYAKGLKVLNAFSYTGGFSVYALSGGAALVHSVDISEEAIRQGEVNVGLNFGEAPHQSFAQDCFEFLKKSEEIYDLMVLDPPAFAKNKRAVANASRGYISLNELGIKRLRPGGLLFTFSCSGSIDRDLFRKIIFTAAAEVGRPVQILHQLTQPADHPINIYHPEGEYLKGLVLRVS